jgi:uncharacterized protein
MIRETIVTTLDPGGGAHIAPIGVHERSPDHLVIAPFRPSNTLDNLLNRRVAVVNHCDDVRVFAGCVTGRRDWPVARADRIDGVRLAGALAHREVEVVRVDDDRERPRVLCRTLHEAAHGPFRGFNRAQAAVIEGAILVSRLHLLPAGKIADEIAYLTIAVDKTAGEAEREAWGWLMERIAASLGRLPAREAGA